MSGLWSFRDTAAPLPYLSDAARASLPTAVIDDSKDDMAAEVSDTSIEDPVRVFGAAADVDGAVREVQNAWLERLLGHEQTPLYRLRFPHQEASGVAIEPPETRDSALYGRELLSPEEMVIVKSVLRMQGTGKEAKANSRGRRRCSNAPTTPVLHAAALASQRKGRQNLRGANAAFGTGVLAQKPINRASDAHTQKRERLLHRDCSAKHTPRITRHAPENLTCDFVERMERRAAQRRLARSALGTSRLLDRATSNASITQNPPAEGAKKARPTLRYDALPLELQVSLISLETPQSNGSGLDRDCQYEAVALRWSSAHLRKKAWRCWCNSQRIRAHRRVNQVSTAVTNIAPAASPWPQDGGGPTPGSLHHAELLTADKKKMQLLRWYFVLWVAFLEKAGGGRLPPDGITGLL
ncbi:uncharacterized protein Tco025E_04601 [Trypanosoma conorhini]|uniref:Uncharacterized protein n=1 Tax=Trypanosoma conorhini TaxID=83891 RepID=A0A422PKB3_9TRYP|nr:uncharacterized protein Tco025E_04601 [Trypanosoma conorhini]RNF18143.1 hypothetical protein Tco025E_04601 [Trypanosoma conorhini]